MMILKTMSMTRIPNTSLKDEEEEAEKAPLSEEEELEQFIDSIQPKKKKIIRQILFRGEKLLQMMRRSCLHTL